MRKILSSSCPTFVVAFATGAILACSADPTRSTAVPASKIRPAAQQDPSTCGRLFAINEQNELMVLTLDKHADKNKKDKGEDHVSIESRQPIVGLAPGERLVGIDFRPATGQLYGLATVGGGAGVGQLYTIDTETAVATPVGAPLAIPLVGTSFGFDFNPVPDRIRVTSNLGQNLRLDPETGAIVAVDLNLAYGTSDPNNGQPPSVVASAHINSEAGATTTLLYDIDSRLDILALQNPPNAGTLNTVGSLGFNTGDAVGFDIGPTNEAFAVLQDDSQRSSRLFSINLSTGAATDLGIISEKKNGPSELITGFAIELGPQCAVP